jgi:nitrile hydratase alpha subunit
MTDAHDGAHAAVETADGPPDYFDVLVAALRELLVAKGLIGADEVRAMVETLDAHGPTIGAGLVARAWVDPDFKARLLDDATAVVEQSGIDNYDDTRFIVLEQTPQVHNLVVCTLCSCYPRPLLGLPPDWYKSRPYRSRAVREPRAVLAEFGTRVPEDVRIRVHDSTANMRYLVMPMRPAGTDGWSEQQLADLVTRDSMIGVSTARTP